MSKTIGKATLEADGDGLVTLQCARCIESDRKRY